VAAKRIKRMHVGVMTIGARPGHDKRDGWSDRRQPFEVVGFSPCPEGRGKPRLGGELRQEELLLTRTRVCVDRVGAYDDLSEGFSLAFPSRLRYDQSDT
jgi:hypothetical protein